ncbi:hypothetical protein ZEAMMB73_Zm00001d053315 [Zea mays]|uniref:Uncharacterized protein n=1 Tax=Zea mays TaxID=4577 RepID=A0A1D6QNV5_MAIZE|nr:hypothetical protein ZEAMMB73_Zm00001d053315 [Zea mays]
MAPGTPMAAPLLPVHSTPFTFGRAPAQQPPPPGSIARRAFSLGPSSRRWPTVAHGRPPLPYPWRPKFSAPSSSLPQQQPWIFPPHRVSLRRICAAPTSTTFTPGEMTMILVDSVSVLFFL